MKTLLIVNPHSGTRSKDAIADMARTTLAGAGHDVEVHFTTAPGDATTAAAQAATAGVDLVVAAGGDGTVNETACGLIGTQTALGIIPCGSGNGLARHVGIPLDPVGAVALLTAGAPLSVDYATVNGRPFFCTCGTGYDAAVSDRFAAKGRRGLMTYVQSAVETFADYEPHIYTIETDAGSETREAFLIAVCNAGQYGNNAWIAPGASIRDGLLDVIVAHPASRLGTMLVGVDLMTGMLGHNTSVDIIRTPRVRITRSAGEHAAHIDGEPAAGLGPVLDIACHPAGLRLVCRADKKPFRPLLTPAQALVRDISLTFRHLFKPV